MFAWRRKVNIHLEQLEERVARLEAEMDHVKAGRCECGKQKSGLTEPYGGSIRVNPPINQTRWTHGPDWKADRP